MTQSKKSEPQKLNVKVEPGSDGFQETLNEILSFNTPTNLKAQPDVSNVDIAVVSEHAKSVYDFMWGDWGEEMTRLAEADPDLETTFNLNSRKLKRRPMVIPELDTSSKDEDIQMVSLQAVQNPHPDPKAEADPSNNSSQSSQIFPGEDIPLAYLQGVQNPIRVHPHKTQVVPSNNSSQSSQSFQSSSRVPPAQKQDKKRKLQNDALKPSIVKRQAIPDDVVNVLKLHKV